MNILIPRVVEEGEEPDFFPLTLEDLGNFSDRRRGWNGTDRVGRDWRAYEDIPRIQKLEYVLDTRKGAEEGSKAFRIATYRKFGDVWERIEFPKLKFLPKKNEKHQHKKEVIGRGQA